MFSEDKNLLYVKSLLLNEGKRHTCVQFTNLALNKLDVDKVGHMLNFVYLLNLIKFHGFKMPMFDIFNVIFLCHVQCGIKVII